MDFAGINEGDGAGQYETTLRDEDTPVPRDGFPACAYVEELNKAQAEMLKQRERKQGGKMDFAAATDAPASRSASGTPGSITSKSGGQRRSRFDEVKGKTSRSRSPKRRR